MGSRFLITGVQLGMFAANKLKEIYTEEKHIKNLTEYLKHPNINICPVTKDSRRPNDKSYCYVCLGFS